VIVCSGCSGALELAITVLVNEGAHVASAFNTILTTPSVYR
jgi:hypothetical protein